MPKGKVIHSREVKPFVMGGGMAGAYSSKMLLDHVVAETDTVQINEGTLQPGRSTHREVHRNHEVYYVIRGEATVHLDHEEHVIGPGSLVFIPAGVHHFLDNKSTSEEFVILTIWANANDNPAYKMRLKAWGKSFKTIYED